MDIVNIFLVFYMLLFIAVYFNSYVFPDISKNTQTILLIMIGLLVLEKITSNYITIEHFISNEAVENINSVYNSGNALTVANLNVTGNMNVSGISTVKTLNASNIQASGDTKTATLNVSGNSQLSTVTSGNITSGNINANGTVSAQQINASGDMRASGNIYATGRFDGATLYVNHGWITDNIYSKCGSSSSFNCKPGWNNTTAPQP